MTQLVHAHVTAPPVERHVVASRPGSSAAALARMAAHDWVLLGYVTIVLGLTLLRRNGTTRPIAFAAFDAVWLVAVLVVVRGLDVRSRVASVVYRLSLIAIPLVSYLQLRWILPVVAPGSLDGELLAFDVRVFGVEPALVLDRWVSPGVTEWFSFFYYSYFFLLALHAIPIAVFAPDGRLLREFAFGLLFVFCTGHLVYMLVPGVGPYAYAATAGTFATALEGKTFWPLVRDAVERAGALRDIFPSLHTAVPVFLTLFAIHHRRRMPFHVTWPLLAFFASQIVIATMYLRWHYLADIVAGVALAATATVLSWPIARWEARRRMRFGASPTFPPPLVLRSVLRRAGIPFRGSS